MIKKGIYIIIFLFNIFIFICCIYNSSINITYTTKKGINPYYTSVHQKAIIFNFNKSVKKIEYCFTTEGVCSDFLTYDVNLNNRIINVDIDYPEFNSKQHICIKITNQDGINLECDDNYYLVDAGEPKIESLYNNIIINKKDADINYKDMFKVSASTGIKDYKCEVEDIDEYSAYLICKATAKNGLSTTLKQIVYYNYFEELEGKEIAFVGDDIFRASNDNFGGFASRVGLANYMDWYSYSSNGKTITETDNSMINDLDTISNNNFDYIILTGGINDLINENELGNLESTSIGTYAGALDYIFTELKEKNKDSKIGFIIPYSVKGLDQETLVDITKRICEKHNIKYLNLYDGEIFEGNAKVSYKDLLKKEKITVSDFSLSSLGYDTISKYISIWVRTL